MVFFNYTTMQVSAKIVYYGPGLCGKTTNLHQIHSRTDPGSRGEMVSLETEADRTLFFDLLPLEVGTIGGMRVRLQLYTVPGQVFYNTTRKLVLKGVDGIVFVADSQEVALEANIESFHNLKQNLDELHQSLDTIPFVFQYNKRDLRHILSAEALDRHLNHDGFEVVEAAAVHGIGVFETLKIISKKTLAAVHRKISGDSQAPARVVVKNEPEPTTPLDVIIAESVAEPEPPASDAGTAATLDSAEPSKADAVFAELEDDIEADAMASITEELEVPPSSADDELGAKASTAEVRIEFPSNPELTQDVAEAAKAAAENKTVATKSRIDIERELTKLREMAFPPTRATSDETPSPKRVVEATRKEHVPRTVLESADALHVDVKLVGKGRELGALKRVRVELPTLDGTDDRRVRLSLELTPPPDDGSGPSES